MYIIVDIDGVLAQNRPDTLIPLLNQELHIGLTEDELKMLPNMHTFYSHPRVRTYRAKVGEHSFKQQRQAAEILPDYLQTCQMMPDACEGVLQLSRLGELRYCTCRKTYRPGNFNDLVAKATYSWLTQSGFVCADQIIFCLTLREKLETIVALLQTSGETTAILIEDHYQKFLEMIPLLPPESQQILRRQLTLWAFGAQVQDLPDVSDILAGLVALPSWKALPHLLPRPIFPSSSRTPF